LERVVSINDANCKHVLLQMLRLYGVHRLSIDAADFIQVSTVLLFSFILRPCGYIDGRSQIKVHTKTLTR